MVVETDVTHYPVSLSRHVGGVFSRSQAIEKSRVGVDTRPGTERLTVMIVWLDG